MNWKSGVAAIEPELNSVRLLSSLIVLFFLGGVAGAVGFKHVGFLFAVPLAMVLLLLAALPVADDIRRQVNAAA